MQTVSISFFRFETVWQKLWAFGQMQFARAPLRALPGLGFFKLFGTGTGEGFTPWPNFGVYAVMATWPSVDHARQQIAQAAVFRRYRDHAAENCTVYLAPVSSRGQWDGRGPFEAAARRLSGTEPVAVITRATVKKRFLLAFWRRTPGISMTVREQTQLRFKMGMGEVPWLQQVTFSIWESGTSMTAFAYGSVHHGEAVRRVRAGGWFKEELYARFAVLGMEGRWDGREPLAGLASPVPAGSMAEV